MHPPWQDARSNHCAGVCDPRRCRHYFSGCDTWTGDWSVTTVSGYDLSATSAWMVDSFSDTAIVLTIDITNTTILSGLLTNADITSFGLGVDPDPSASFITGGAGTTFDIISSNPNQNFPGGYKSIDVCIYADGCSGGNTKNGLRAGETDTLKILLSGDFSSGFAELLYFPLKFQTSDGSCEPGGRINGDCPRKVPEPPTPLLHGAGLLLMQVLHRGRLLPVRARC